jgi:hypothetical protein
MALRLRRGTNAERLLITPVEGELIYTTDTKLLYAGDGTTAGGTLVAAGAGGSTTLNALTDTDLTGATNNDVLKFNAGTNKWEPSDGSTLDALTDTDLTGAADGEVLQFNNATSKWESVAVPTLSAISLDDLTDVFLTSSPADAGDVLQFNGNHFVAVAAEELFNEQQNYKINIVGDDSTIMINTDNNNIVGSVITANSGFVGDLTGAVVGTVLGDVKGSVFGDDSTLMVDGVNNQISGQVNTNRINSSANASIVLENAFRAPLQIKCVTTGSLGGYPYLDINSVKGSFDNPIGIVAGEVAGAWKISGYVDETTGASATVGVGSFASTATMSDDSPESVFTLVTGGGGTSFNLFNFDHTGQFIAPGPVTPGVFADPTARDAAITTPAAGMIVFLTDSTGASGAAKHQGYDGSSWNNLY